VDRGLQVTAFKRHIAALTLVAAAPLSVSAETERPGTFSIPGSILLFGTYDDLRVAKADANRNPVIGVLTLATGELQIFGEGFDPSWSPDGEWIAYYAPGGAALLMMHANGSGLNTVRRLRQGFFSYGSFIERGPVWSPDSKQLLVTIFREETRLDIMLIDLASRRATTRLKNVPVTPYGWVTQPDG